MDERVRRFIELKQNVVDALLIRRSEVSKNYEFDAIDLALRNLSSPIEKSEKFVKKKINSKEDYGMGLSRGLSEMSNIVGDDVMQAAYKFEKYFKSL